jgi:predicted Rdx family selenoprotein
VSAVTLIPSQGGVHEVRYGDHLLHSKKATGKHPEPTEIIELIGALSSGAPPGQPLDQG